jgi:hypothetical protein
MQSLLTDEDTETIYDLVTEYFGSMKADAVYHDLAHQY